MGETDKNLSENSKKPPDSVINQTKIKMVNKSAKKTKTRVPLNASNKKPHNAKNKGGPLMSPPGDASFDSMEMESEGELYCSDSDPDGVISDNCVEPNNVILISQLIDLPSLSSNTELGAIDNISKYSNNTSKINHTAKINLDTLDIIPDDVQNVIITIY